ncbi:MAG: heavy metal translocating P-type ATPase [Haloarculaceae archaeon]
MTTCTLCDLDTPSPPVTDETVEGAFCCRGCLEIARTLDDPESVDAETASEELDTGPEDAEGAVAYLDVAGMHCATCETFIEARATDHEGVRAAEANYPTGAVRLTYDPGRVERADLLDLLTGMGYTASDRDGEDGDGDREIGRLLVGGFFGMMVMLWYVLFLYPSYLGLDTLLFDPSGSAGTYLLANVWIMATVVVGYVGWPLLRGAYVSLRAGQPNMDLLVALAATTAYCYSTVALLLGRVEVYFDVAIVVVLAVTVGNYYQERVRRRAAGRLGDLTEQRADRARRRTDDGTEAVAVSDLAAGDEVVVRAGERVPIDGTVSEGTAALDRSLVTGESVPERVEPADEVIGGALVTEGGIVVRVAEDAESTLDRLVELLWSVQSGRAGVQRLADRIAAAFVPVVVVLAPLAAVGHLLLGAAPTDAFLTGLAVLVVSCPCALGLATPLAVAAGTRRALDDGIVVTDGSVFETAREVDAVALDKTGTLTTGEMELIEAPGEEALAKAAAVESLSDHPLAAAVTEASGPTNATVEDFETYPGRGVGGRVDGQRVLVGNLDLFDSEDWTVPAELRDQCERARERGRLPALVGWDGRARDLLVAGDRLRPEWEAVVGSLSSADRDVVLITGDSPAAARPFREHPEIDEVFAEVPPEAKAEVIERLRAEGTVAMVGDGSNDAPALAAADLGIALATGTRLAGTAADAVVTTDDLRAVPEVFAVTRATRRRIRQNLGWAFCYNAVAVPVAVAGLLNPLFAALAMTASSLLVVGNSARSLAADGDADERPERRADAPGRPAAADGIGVPGVRNVETEE